MNYKRMVPNSISGLSQMLGLISIYLSMEKDFSLAAIFIILPSWPIPVTAVPPGLWGSADLSGWRWILSVTCVPSAWHLPC